MPRRAALGMCSARVTRRDRGSSVPMLLRERLEVSLTKCLGAAAPQHPFLPSQEKADEQAWAEITRGSRVYRKLGTTQEVKQYRAEATSC